MCGILICGLSDREKILETPPSGMPDLPNDVICTFCCFQGKPVYQRMDTWYTFFLIPICHVMKGDVCIVCASCKNFLASYTLEVCNQCHTVMPAGYIYCGRCGNSKIHARRSGEKVIN
ncbi:hypothetical protein TCON_0092 [Astathelohania contejeani]|uniref:Zinc-ribbon 15 domain-containing protein n=1 Tax=Astathelohania contejeani TaxID=164912 RepID=A0ABQ7I2N0_9MICR|nr:hypothetical protein TCON_0092 [Thelohania contejeani]